MQPVSKINKPDVINHILSAGGALAASSTAKTSPAM